MNDLPVADDIEEVKPRLRSHNLLRDHWALFLILSLAVGLRLWQINESLWLDELHSAWVVSSSVSEVVERAWIGNQSPLYFFLPWLTSSLFGMSEWSLRLPSLFAGTMIIAVAYALIFAITKSRIAACTTAVLAAVDTNFLFYATEVRPYACVQLVAVAQLYSFWRLQIGPTLRLRFVFVSLSVLLFYLHYTAILLLGGELVFCLISVVATRYRRTENVYSPRNAIVDGICILVLITPVVFHLVEISSRRDNWASFVRDPSMMLTIDWFSLDSYIAVPVIICVTIAGLACLRSYLMKALVDGSRLRKFAFAVLLFACWLVVPLAIVWISTANDIAKLYLLRYVVGAALAPMLVAGLCVGIWSDRRLQTIVAIGTLAFVCYSSTITLQWQYDGRLFGDRQENWRDAVGLVNENDVENCIVFVRSGLLEADIIDDNSPPLMREYCVAPIASIYRVDDQAYELRPLTTSRPGNLTKQDLVTINEARAAWFVVNGSERTRQHCRDDVLRILSSAEEGWTVTLEQSFGFVGVFLIKCDGK